MTHSNSNNHSRPSSENTEGGLRFGLTHLRALNSSGVSFVRASYENKNSHCNSLIQVQGIETSEIIFVSTADVAREGEENNLLRAMVEKGMGLRLDDLLIVKLEECNSSEKKYSAAREMQKKYSPKVIVVLGEDVARAVLSSEKTLAELTGILHEVGGSKVAVLNSLSEILVDESLKKSAWRELMRVISYLGL